MKQMSKKQLLISCFHLNTKICSMFLLKKVEKNHGFADLFLFFQIEKEYENLCWFAKESHLFAHQKPMECCFLCFLTSKNVKRKMFKRLLRLLANEIRSKSELIFKYSQSDVVLFQRKRYLHQFVGMLLWKRHQRS